MTKAEIRNEVKHSTIPKTAEFEKIVLSQPEYISAKSVFIYVSINGEPETGRIIEDALSLGKTVCVPKCGSHGAMKAVRINTLSDLRPGKYGIPEPTDGSELSPEEIELMIVPCVCAGKDGSRLGHGAGYYDRFMAKTRAHSMCLCFSDRIRQDIPMEAFDVYTDSVITENGRIK